MFSPLQTVSMLYLRQRPFMLNHKINIACDCRCRFCNSWRIKEEPAQLLTREEIASLLGRARQAGMLSYSIWGGEPLLREDTPEALTTARRLGFFTTVSTNASILADRADDFIPCTNRFLISLDGLAETHDRVRGFPGLFTRALRGIDEIKKRGGTVRLYYNVNLATASDLEGAARLACDLKVSIYYFPAIPIVGYNEKIILDRETTRDLFSRVLDLKRQGYPVLNLPSYLKVIRDGLPTHCSFPRYHIYIDHDGTLYTCDLGPDDKLAEWGDCRDTDLVALFDSPAFHPKTRALENCNACRLSCAEIGSGNPPLQFAERVLARLRHEWIFQRS